MNSTQNCSINIEKLIQFGLHNHMLKKWDVQQVRNQLMELLNILEPVEESVQVESFDSPIPILQELLDYAVELEMIRNTVTERDLLDAKIMAQLMPRQSELNTLFQSIENNEGIEAATKYYYKLSQDSNYIRMDRIAKNMNWLSETAYGTLEITINLSKPEKDPAEIAAERNAVQVKYPKCLLCIENVGYYGRLNHPGRSNHRVIPITLTGEQWYFQYSPYVYYNEHAIIFSEEHRPMTISTNTFKRILEFVEQFPHYFIGSNADLPIVGGSILSHDHFQGGNHHFAMDFAKTLKNFAHPAYPNVKIKMVKWPLSVVRLSSKNKEDLIRLSDTILQAWRGYSDESVDIHAFSGEVPHNTITPIARMNERAEYEIDLTLRNNRTTEEFPDGIFHPHAELHHIKKENIGLIEVMGLAVLPARLKDELALILDVLVGETPFDEALQNESLIKHKQWMGELIAYHGDELAEADAKAILEEAVGYKFMKVLECAGVFKQEEKGLEAFERFIQYFIAL